MKYKAGCFHIHIDTDHPLLFRKCKACFDGIVKKIANDAAQVNFGHLELDRNVRIDMNIDILCTCREILLFNIASAIAFPVFTTRSSVLRS